MVRIFALCTVGKDGYMKRNQEAVAFAPAKLNLSLEILGRREDGYHLLHSVMQAVGRYNVVTVSASDTAGIQLESGDEALPAGPENAAWRAAEAFFGAVGEKPSVRILVEKQIPWQAGLGSASADAAGTLTALNALYGSPLGREELSALGALVGADVPFCLAGGTMLAEGVGELLTPLPTPDGLFYVIVKPEKVGVSTPEAYRLYDATPRGKRSRKAAGKLARFLRRTKGGDPAGIAPLLRNDLEAPAAPPESLALKELLLGHGALAAQMTGSGSAVFGIFTSREEANLAQEALSQPGTLSFFAAHARGGAEIFRVVE